MSARSCKKRTGYDSERKIDSKNPGVAAVNFGHLIRWELPKKKVMGYESLLLNV